MMFLFLSNQHMLRACVPVLFSAISVEKLRWKLAIIGLLFGADHFSFVSMVFCPESEIGTTNSQQWICEITMHQARLSVHFIRPEIGVGITDRQGKHALTNQKLLYIWTAARCKFHFSMSLLASFIPHFFTVSRILNWCPDSAALIETQATEKGD